MDVFLDDRRQTPFGWTRVYWPDQAIALLESGKVELISLDHDLGDDTRRTGMDVLLWIERAVMESEFSLPDIRIHTASPVARKKMQTQLDKIIALAESTASSA